MLKGKKMKKWLIGSVILWSLAFTPCITASISNEFNNREIVEVTIKTVRIAGIEEDRIELSKHQFEKITKLLNDNDVKNREKRVDVLNTLLASHSLPLIPAEKINIEGKATRVNVFKPFSRLRPVLRWLLMLLIRNTGKILTFGYCEPGGAYDTYLPSLGWVLIDNNENLTGKLRGTLGFLQHGDKIYDIGVKGFTGTIIEIPPEKYFIGYAKEVGIETV